MDVDIVADLVDSSVSPLLAELSDDYYMSEPAIRNAILNRSSFNLIHYATSFKIDVFVNRGRAFEESVFARAAPGQLGQSANFFAPIASAEDTIISKLEWYRLGGEVSQRQWNDVTNVLKLLGSAVDEPYLRQFAKYVGVADLLDRVFNELRQL